MNTETTTETPNEDIETKTEEDQAKWYMDWKNWVKIAILLVILTFIVLAIVFNKTTGAILTGFLNWMQNNALLGSVCFIGIYWFCTVMFIPGSLLTLGAGVVFRVIAGPWGGVFLATLVVIIGAGLGASTAFLLGRFVFREKVESYKSKYEKFDTIDKVVEQQGLKVTILLRLSPVIPFSAFNYFMGLTGVSFRDYNIAHIGMIPGTLAYCFIGGTLGAVGESVGFTDDPVVLIVTIVGTVIAVAGMIYISYVAKKEFAKIAAEHEANNEAGDSAGPAQKGTGDYQAPQQPEPSAPTDGQVNTDTDNRDREVSLSLNA